MNLYFAALSLAALLMTPVSFRLRLKLGKETVLRLKLLFGSIPVGDRLFRMLVKRRSVYMEQKGLLGSEAHEYRAQDVDPSALRTVLASLDRGLIVRALHALRIRSARLELCLSGKDAAATAISFAALKTVSQALLQARLWPKDATLRLRADFSAEHSALDFEGIVSVRMGSLLLVAGAFGARLLALKKYRAPKERLYAASH